MSLKYVARFAYGDALPRTDDESEGHVKVFGSNGPYTTFSQANTRAPAVVIGRKGSYGKVNWTKEACFASDTTFFVDETMTKQCLRWLFYVFQTLNLDKGTDEAAVPGLNRDNAYEKKVLVPPLPEQRTIAAYLDRETAKIDELISEKKRLIELLAEKRRALTTHAVTRGLDPDVPMRASGVEWLGEIPQHWEAPPVYARYDVVLGKMLDEKRISGAHLSPYLRNLDVQWHRINVRNLPRMDFHAEEKKTYALKKGDILICEGGEIGRTAIWQEQLPECYYQKALHRLRPITSLDNPEFFAFVMESVANLGVFAAESNQSTIQHLTAEKLRVFRFPSPPLREQEKITTHVRSETDKISDLYRIVERTTRLLYERRATLISAAVTGQIRVGVES